MDLTGSESNVRSGFTPVMEGTQVGAYRVLQRLGAGGMGEVWLAEHTMLGRRAAIKVLHPEYSSNDEVVNRFFNEARSVTSINDPGIVQIFDYGHHSDGSAYIVMELLEGEPLDRRLARCGALGLLEALRIMRQIASALGAVHARGIIHRDLKPENVFIVRDSEVDGGERAKILDFGIAKLVGDHGGLKTQTQVVMGTPRYMSPEQCRGAGAIDRRSDVYSLGCLLFALLVGRPPFDSEGVGEIIAMHLREPPPVPSSLRPGIPPEIDRLVLRCLEKDPARRFGHSGELVAVLGSLRGLSLQLEALGSGPAYAKSTPTTLCAAAGVMGAAAATAAARRFRPEPLAIYAGFGVMVAGGAIAIAVIPGGLDAVISELGLSSASAPAVAVPADPPADLLPAPAPQAADLNADVAARTKDVLSLFVAWSRKHQGAPCPEITELVDAPRDPWAHVFRLTCAEQPADQIIGVISAGLDGTPSTADDIASWQLGREVTDCVRGTRWAAAALAPSKPLRIKREPVDDIEQEPVTAIAKPAEPEPVVNEKPIPTKPSKEIELDENGLPIQR
jgi:serine/threonine-protein kinase